jgi:periplasmic protein TonB
MYRNSGKAFINREKFFVPEEKTITFHPWIKPEQPATRKATVHASKSKPFEMPPKIVASVNINKLPATPLEVPQSLTGIEGNENDFPQQEINRNRIIGKVEVNSPPAFAPKPMMPVILDDADIMPEYPGGLKALLLFLKKNIQSPEEVEQGDEVAVKIKFVVNYNGKLDGFDVIQSGGSAFDNEVLRVLKKMPMWIPGKSHGENVSVYYIVPVRFSNAF